MPLLLVILIWPLAEIWLLIQVGANLGALTTLLLLIVSAVLGVVLVQLEWQRLIAVWQRKMHTRPVEPNAEDAATSLVMVLESAALGVAGILFIVPGFLSDFLGLLLLLPLTRKFLFKPLKFNSTRTTNSYQQPRASQDQGKIIEGEFQRKDEP